MLFSLEWGESSWWKTSLDRALVGRGSVHETSKYCMSKPNKEFKDVWVPVLSKMKITMRPFCSWKMVSSVFHACRKQLKHVAEFFSDWLLDYYCLQDKNYQYEGKSVIKWFKHLKKSKAQIEKKKTTYFITLNKMDIYRDCKTILDLYIERDR